MKKTKNIFFIFISVILVLFIFLSGLLLLKNQKSFKKGNIRIYDSENNLLAQLNSSGSGLEYLIDGCEDYIENVLSEATYIINKKYSASYTKEQLLNCELKIYTNFSKDCFNSLKNAFSLFSYEDKKLTESAIVTPDGKLLASIGKNGKKNLINTPHKAGSAIKPISVYAPALEENIINWATSIEDSPFKRIKTDNGLRDWPANYEGIYSNLKQTLQYSIAKSLNTASVRVLNKLTPKKSCDFLEEVGINADYEKKIAQSGNYEDIYGNLALGELKNGVTTENLASAYQIFANGGNYTELYSINRISENKKIIYTSAPTAKRIISASNAEIMNKLLSGVVSNGGTAEKAMVEGLKIAGKTGTSQGYKDNWFVGFTPDYICSVWYGYDKPLTERGENGALTVFKQIITGLEAKNTDFPKSEDTVTAEYCIYSEMLASEGCNKTETGYFNKNNLPQKCTRH